MKTIYLIILIIITPFPSLFYVFYQTDTEVLWRILKDWFPAILFITGAIFLAYRGYSYTELVRLAATRKETIADRDAEITRLKAKIAHYEMVEEIEEMKKLRRQGDDDYIHRSKP